MFHVKRSRLARKPRFKLVWPERHRICSVASEAASAEGLVRIVIHRNIHRGFTQASRFGGKPVQPGNVHESVAAVH